MIAFFTQYYRGLGHSNRIKLIAQKTKQLTDCIVVDHLFKPPFDYGVENVAFLEDKKVPEGETLSRFVMSENLINYRIERFKQTLDTYKVKLLVCEGFPFCRQQFSVEYFKYFEECKKRNIKIVISIRDFPWDDPHENSLQDWVNYTQNLVCKHYAEKILVHGDPAILPLQSDRTRFSNSNDIIKDIEDKIVYTGYVSDDSQKPHKRKNNIIYVSTGLNKEEGMLLFKEVTKIAHKFPEYRFVMPVANRYLKTGASKRDNMIFVDYIPELGKKIQSCAALITYGGYNTTMEVLKSSVPAIFVPRQDGYKLEQFVRCYVFEPYGFFKVLNNKEFHHLEATLNDVLSNKPNEFEYNMNGAINSANEIFRIYRESFKEKN